MRAHQSLSDLIEGRLASPDEQAELVRFATRLFVEERRRLKIIPNAFGEKPVLKLMFGAMIRAAERWRTIRITDFERQQMLAIREELDQEYEARNGLAANRSADAHHAELSSSSRT